MMLSQNITTTRFLINNQTSSVDMITKQIKANINKARTVWYIHVTT